MTAIVASNFQSNSLSGTVSVVNGFANISVGTNPYALEGNKSFVIKLRKGSIQGDVVATSPTITLQDTSSFVSLVANVFSVNEGNLVQFTLTTSNAVDGATLYYSANALTPNLTLSDFYNGANTGYATIFNNQAIFSLYANTDSGFVNEDNETFNIQLRSNNPTGNVVYSSSANVAIVDFYKSYNILGLVESASSVAEGGTITLTFIAHNVPAGTLFYYYTDGNATTSTFTGGNTGSFIMNSTSNTISLPILNVPYGTTQNFNVKVRKGSSTGTLYATSNTLIAIDPSLVDMHATGGNVILAGGYKYHVYNTSATFNVTVLGFANVEYLVVAGGGGGGSNEPNYSGGAGGGGGGAVQAGYSILTSTGNFTVTVGAGAGQPTYGGLTGSNSSILFGPSASVGDIDIAGGRGGGARGFNSGTGGMSGNGYAGGSAPPGAFDAPGGGGGGGSGGNGSPATTDGPYPSRGGGNGGPGVDNSILGVPVYRGGGGGGGSNPSPMGPGGPAPYRGLGGAGGGGLGGSPSPAAPGVVNSGGGGGGAGSSPREGSLGGSGVVIIKYPFTSQVFNGLTSTSNVYLVGANITFTLDALNANNKTLYYTTDGNVNATHFIGGNTGSFVANATGGILTLQANTNIPLDETRNFRLQIRQDSTTGFISGSSANIEIGGYSTYISATGGNQVIDTSGYRYHIFLSSNNFTVTKVAAGGNIEILAVAGGGGSGFGQVSPSWGPTGGGGAGGYVLSNLAIIGSVNITVGAGGASSMYNGISGSNTTIGGANVISVGGGGGGVNTGGNPGGSGGGGGGVPGYGAMPGGNGYGYPSPTQQGYPGGAGFHTNPPTNTAGGGGGAGGAGTPWNGSLGGIGAALSWPIPSSYGTSGPAPGRYFAGGGSGKGAPGTPIAGGGGGGDSSPGITNTGGGGGGTSTSSGTGGNGGSGIVIIRYPVYASGASSVEYLLVAGGGSGGSRHAGGGGAGGYLSNNSYSVTPDNTYTVTIGGGGAGVIGSGIVGINGSNTIISSPSISSIIAVGGGAGGAYAVNAINGGSGGGGGYSGGAASAGYNYPGPTQQGYPGGGSTGQFGYDGGGGGGAGGTGVPSGSGGGAGGIGLYNSLSGSSIAYAGGGGGGGYYNVLGGNGGTGGGGAGGARSVPVNPGNGEGIPGSTNTGGGGGGAGGGTVPDSGVNFLSGAGGSGVAIFRHPGSYRIATTTGANVTVTSDVSGNVVYTFYSSGTITF